MAHIEARTTADIDGIFALAKRFPALQHNVADFIGNIIKKRFYEKFLSGQRFNLIKYPYDRAGKQTVSATVFPFRTNVPPKKIRIAAYPLNLFERGRTLRNGEREQGRYIFKRSLKPYVGSEIQSFSDRAFDKVMSAELKKV